MLISTPSLFEDPTSGRYRHPGPIGAPLSDDQVLWTYCGLDSALTVEVGEHIVRGLPPAAQLVYSFERALRAPALDMALRGVLVDTAAREDAIRALRALLGNLHGIINRMAGALWDKRLDPASPAQLTAFFYGAMRCEPIYAVERGGATASGEPRLTTGKIAMDKLHERYPILRPIIDCLRHAKRFGKQLSVLQTQVSRDGRMRTSFNPAATETGRWSSSRAFDGSGSNLQNVEEILRRVFIADSGKKLAYIDKKSAESICVGYLSGCEAYLQACFDPIVDIHTYVAHMVWPDLPWPAEPAKWRKFAESHAPPEYGGKDLRDISKRLGHLSNYGGSPGTASRIAKISFEAAADFQRRYFHAFPEIRLWHHVVAELLARDGTLVTPFGRPRQFFGRRRDDSTLREAIAHMPQSMTADDLNLGMYRVWKHLHASGVELLLQVHDAILIQYPERLEEQLLPQVMAALVTPVPVRDLTSGQVRTMRVPVDCAVGYNFAKEDSARKRFPDGNPDGLRGWAPEKPDPRRRLRRAEDSWKGFRAAA